MNLLLLSFRSNIPYAFLTFFILFFLYPLCSYAAASYVPLVGIPGVSNTGNGNLAEYFNRLYLLTISIGAIIAVIKMFMAGIKWSMSDVITDKSSAKADIRGALLGLAILLVPFIVLREIYPDLTNLNFLRNAPTVTLTPNPSAPSTTGSPSGGDYGTPIDYGSEARTYSQSEFDALTPMDFASLEANCSPKELVITSSGTSRILSCGTATPPAAATPPTPAPASSNADPAIGECGDGNCQDLSH